MRPLKEHEIVPTYSNEAMSDVDGYIWKKAIEVEFQSMYSNQIWELIEVPKRIKLIQCKWIYKKKNRVGGKV